jgi:hypothetical protein
MPKFILAFRGGMPKSPDEGQKMMASWNAWIAEMGPALVDRGAGFGKSRFLVAPGKEGPAGDALSGYSIIEAPDMDAALKAASRNPIFSLGGTIEVAPCMSM